MPDELKPYPCCSKMSGPIWIDGKYCRPVCPEHGYQKQMAVAEPARDQQAAAAKIQQEGPLYAQLQPPPEQPSADLVEAALKAFNGGIVSEDVEGFDEYATKYLPRRAMRTVVATVANATEKQIVAWLRAKPAGLGCRYEPSLLADAIERGAHKEHQP